MKRLLLFALLIVLIGANTKTFAQSKSFKTSFSQKISNGNCGFGNIITKDDRFGDGIAVIGDVDGNGTKDLAVGADYYDGSTNDQGMLYIILLESDYKKKSIQKITIYCSSRFGLRICTLGDYNKDGVTDIAVGAIGENSYTGAIYLC
ncbi:MAG: integrin alpha [Bacteroidota bacterium]|nr:integrin alpha [Bacteroidota bacterium]